MTPDLTLDNFVAAFLQSAAIALVGLGALRLLRIDAPAVRYNLLRVALLLAFGVPLLQPAIPAPSEATPAANMAEAPVPPPLHSDVTAASGALASPVLDGFGAAFIGGLLVAGAVGRLIWLAFGFARVQRLRDVGLDGGGGFDDLQRVIGTAADIRYVPGLSQPLTFGLAPPLVLLPGTLRGMDEPIQRAVAAHELWHVRRRDWMWMLAEEILRSVFWFHPPLWALISAIQNAREEVVDELAILTTGSRRRYLDALVAFADARAPLALAMFGRRRQMVHRVLMITKENAMSSTRLVACGSALVLALAVSAWVTATAFPLSAAQPPRDPVRTPSDIRAAAEKAEKEAALRERAEKYPSKENYLLLAQYSWEQAFRDASLSDSDRARHVDQGLDAVDLALALDGSYLEALVYKNLLLRSKAQSTPDPAENRRLIVEADALRARAMELRKSQDPAQTREMEAKVFSGAAGGAPPPPPPPPPPPAAVDGVMPLRVGGNIAPPAKIHDVPAIYPPIAKAAGVQGVVVVEIVVDAAGSVRDARIVQSIPLLDHAALDAIKQCRFQPTLVNGQAMPVSMTVTMNFALP